MTDRLVPEERIKTISINTIVSRRDGDDFIKITKDRMIEAVAKSLAERLFKFDKVLIKERELNGVKKFDSVLLFVQLDVIVPK